MTQNSRNRRHNYPGVTLLLLVFLLVSSLPLRAQNPYSRFKYLTTNEGLSSNRVRAILRDSRDFLWIATDVGLDRYDSYSFKNYHFDQEKEGSISRGLITGIFEDSNNNLWIGSTGGLNLYDRTRDQFRVFRHSSDDPKSLGNDFVIGIGEDGDGDLWIVTGGNCLNRWIRKTGLFERYVFDSMMYTGYPLWVRSIDFDSGGNIWLSGTGNSLLKFDRQSREFTRFSDRRANLGIGTYKCIYVDNADKVWIGTSGNGFFSFDPVLGIFHAYKTSNTGTGPNQTFILDVVPENDNYLLLATDHGGINRFDRMTGQFEYTTYNPKIPDGLNNSGVSCLFLDRENMLWAGTTGGGVNYHNPKKEQFRLFRHNSNNPGTLVYNVVSTFMEDHEGMIWIGTDGGGISIFDPRKETFRNFSHIASDQSGLSGNAISSIRQDRDRDVWISSWDGGIDRFDRKSGRFFHYKINRYGPDLPVIALYLDDNGLIWAAVLNRGLIQIDKKRGVVAEYTAATHNGIPFEGVLSFTGCANGDVWMASQDGIILWNKMTGRFSRVNFHDNTIMGFFCDSAGNLWVGSSSSGIYYCKSDGTLMKHFTTNNGLPDNFIRAITQDNHLNIWISTNQGICRYDPQKQTFRNYTVEDGLQGSQFHYQSVLRTRQGEIYFGGSNGFNAFYPDSLEENNTIPKIYLTDFQIFNKPVALTKGGQYDTVISEAKTITLPWKQSVFSLSFTAINYTTPEKNQYAYRMEGFDKEWNQTDATRRYVTYTNLDPGTYVFRVVASNNDLHWNNEGVSLKITILPPWWKTLWFRIMAFIALITVLATGYLLRVNQLKKNQMYLQKQVAIKTAEIESKNEVLSRAFAEREKFFSIIAHDLRSPFNAIVGFSDLLMRQTDKEHLASLHKFAVLIHSASERMFNLLNNLLEWASSQQGLTVYQPVRFNLSEVLSEELDLLNGPVNAKNLHIVSSFPAHLELEADKNMMKTIIRNLINNAIKYSYRGGSIEVGATQTDTGTIIFVKDYGMGMEKDEMEKLFKLEGSQSATGTENEQGTGLGLLLCKSFVEKHNGSISAESEPGSGSIFRVTIPHTIKTG